MDFDELLFWMGVGYATASDLQQCATIEAGMTAGQVLMILGSPSEVERGDDYSDEQVWFYLELLDVDCFEVHFRQGTVVATS